MSDDGWGSDDAGGFGASLEVLAAQSARDTFELLDATEDKLYGDAAPLIKDDVAADVEGAMVDEDVDGGAVFAGYDPWAGGAYGEPPPEPCHVEWQQAFVNLRVRGRAMGPAPHADGDQGGAATDTPSADPLPTSSFVPAVDGLYIAGARLVPRAAPTADLGYGFSLPASRETSRESVAGDADEGAVDAYGEEVFASHGILEEVLDASWPDGPPRADALPRSPATTTKITIAAGAKVVEAASGRVGAASDPGGSADGDPFAPGWCTDPRRSPPMSPCAAAQHEAATAAAAAIWNTFMADCRAGRNANPGLFR
jgi:hypothetical protein